MIFPPGFSVLIVLILRVCVYEGKIGHIPYKSPLLRLICPGSVNRQRAGNNTIGKCVGNRTLIHVDEVNKDRQWVDGKWCMGVMRSKGDSR